ERKRHLAQLARLLPRPEQLFAQSRQRLDQAGERLGLGLSRNLQIHRAKFVRAEALLRDRPIRERIARARDNLATLDAPAKRCEEVHLSRDRSRLEALSRVLESVSYRGVLERGFALVRDADGKVRRRAADIKAGEALQLAFADGEKTVRAEGAQAPAPRGKKS